MAVVLRRLSREFNEAKSKFRPGKYRNQRVKLDSFTFDSIKEKDRYLVLLMRQKRGEISELVVHPKFPLIVNGEKAGTYIGDFSYRKNGEFVVEDVKSKPTARLPAYRIKKKLMRSLLGIEIREI